MSTKRREVVKPQFGQCREDIVMARMKTIDGSRILELAIVPIQGNLIDADTLEKLISHPQPQSSHGGAAKIQRILPLPSSHLHDSLRDSIEMAFSGALVCVLYNNKSTAVHVPY